MSIIIFGDLFSFPEGNAATNRVYTYAKGFIENGTKVYVIGFLNTFHDVKEGTMDGIKYYIPFAPYKRSNYFVLRGWEKILKFSRTYSIIKKINKTDKIIAINSWSNNILTHLFGRVLASLSRAKFIIECSEHPLRYYQNNTFQKKIGELNFYIETNLCDGVFCISNYLIDFYKSKGYDNKKLFLVPSTVDPSRFNKVGKRPIDSRYIGYFGSLTFERDNVNILIHAFAEFSLKYKEIQLILGGFCSINDKKKLLSLITELNIQNKVQVLEYLTREEIITYISHADILVMVRSDDLESKASYPSKLTEFLASSKPVISVNVGEISLYLSDGVNAFLVEPQNAEALANKLEYVINNYEFAEKVGLKGKELTATIFNYNYQAKRMIAYINSL